MEGDGYLCVVCWCVVNKLVGDEKIVNLMYVR